MRPALLACQIERRVPRPVRSRRVCGGGLGGRLALIVRLLMSGVLCCTARHARAGVTQPGLPPSVTSGQGHSAVHPRAGR